MRDEPPVDEQLDASGLNCPLPILKAKKALATMELGQTLHVIATDPGAEADFDAFAEQTGHKLIRAWKIENAYHFLLEKRAKRR
ncbi:MAG: sulfurtransferase TusA family protein [Pseudomonadota bacterium]